MRRAILLLLAAVALAVPAATASSGADGGYRVVYLPPKTRYDRQMEQLLKQSRLVEQIVGALNDSFVIPRTVTVYLAPNKSGPLYSRQGHLILLNLDFLEYVLNTVQVEYPRITPHDLGARWAEIVSFVLLHEVGHSWVDLWHLPVLGREEDAVDSLAAVIMARFVDGGGDMALTTAGFFEWLASHKRYYDAVDFWDVHSLDAQRADEIVCWVYGSNPGKYAYLRKVIPPSRAAGCPAEFKQKVDAWLQLIRPHVRHH
jgi:hypothetical protein